MTVLDVIKSKFESETVHWLALNFETHVNYLKTLFLKKYSGNYNDAAFDKALQTFKSDNRTGVKQLCGVLETALGKMFADEQRKGDQRDVGLAMAKKKKKIRIELVRSPLGRKPNQRKTVAALGLRRLNQAVELEATDPVLGMVRTVSHLVEVKELN